MNEIHLKELVQEIRRQLEDLDRERFLEQAEPFLELQTIDLELKFMVVKSATAKSGFDLKILAAGGEDQIRSEDIQTVTIHYRVDPDYQGFGPRAHRSTPSHRDDPDFQPLK